VHFSVAEPSFPAHQSDVLHCALARVRLAVGYPTADRGVTSGSCRPISARSRRSVQRECSGFPVPNRWGCPLEPSSVRSTGSSVCSLRRWLGCPIHHQLRVASASALRRSRWCQVILQIFEVRGYVSPVSRFVVAGSVSINPPNFLGVREF